MTTVKCVVGGVCVCVFFFFFFFFFLSFFKEIYHRTTLFFEVYDYSGFMEEKTKHLYLCFA